MKERIISIRKASGLNQEKFGEKLGVGKWVIVNIELGRTQPSDLFIGRLCEVFDVSENWLRDGIGDPIAPNALSLVDDLVKRYNLTSLDRMILEAFLDLDPDERRAVTGYINSIHHRIQTSEMKSALDPVIDSLEEAPDASDLDSAN